MRGFAFAAASAASAASAGQLAPRRRRRWTPTRRPACRQSSMTGRASGPTASRLGARQAGIVMRRDACRKPAARGCRHARAPACCPGEARRETGAPCASGKHDQLALEQRVEPGSVQVDLVRRLADQHQGRKFVWAEHVHFLSTMESRIAAGRESQPRGAGLPPPAASHGRPPACGRVRRRSTAHRAAPVRAANTPAYPTLTWMRRGFASSRRGMVSLSTPSRSCASMRETSKSGLMVNARQKRG